MKNRHTEIPIDDILIEDIIPDSLFPKLRKILITAGIAIPVAGMAGGLVRRESTKEKAV